jgi:hypothetical protein
MFKDEQLDNLIINNSLVLSSVRDITNSHLNPTQGVLVYNEADDRLYVGDGTGFILIQGGVSPTVTLTSAGGQSLVNDGTGPALAVKGLTAGTGISLTDNVTSVSIANTNPDITTLSSVGGTDSLVEDGMGPTLGIKGLTAGANITLDSSADAITINAAIEDATLDSAGGVSLVNDGTGPALITKGLVAGTNVTLTSDANTVTVNATADDVTLASAGGESLVTDGTGPALEIKGLSAGTNVSLFDDVDAIVISSIDYLSFTPVFGIHTNFTVSLVEYARSIQYGTGSGSRVHFEITLHGTIDVGPVDVVIQFDPPVAAPPVKVITDAIGGCSISTTPWTTGAVVIPASTSLIEARMAYTGPIEDTSVFIHGTYILA